MQRGLIVDRDLLAGFYVTQGNKENVVVKNLHEGVWRTGMIYVMRTVATAATVQTPLPIYLTDPERLSMRASFGFGV